MFGASLGPLSVNSFSFRDFVELSMLRMSDLQEERKEAMDVVVAALETTTDYLHTKVAAQVSAAGAGAGAGSAGGNYR